MVATDFSSQLLPPLGALQSISFWSTFSSTSRSFPSSQSSAWLRQCSLSSSQLFQPLDSPKSSVLTVSVPNPFVEDRSNVSLPVDKPCEAPLPKRGKKNGSALALDLGPPWDSPLVGCPFTQPKKRLIKKKKAVVNNLYESQQWEFLKQLPHQLLRDVAFVIACPSIIMDSNELPLVNKEMIGETGTWQIAAKWLKGLDADEVAQWFEARGYPTRLDDLFASCIEYILNFSPGLQAYPLFVSQQVETLTLHNLSSLGLLRQSNGKFGCFETKDGGVVSKVIVRQFGNDVLMKRLGTIAFDKDGTIKEVADSEVENLIIEFKRSRFDDDLFSYQGDEELHTEEITHENCLIEHTYLDLLYKGSDNLFKMMGLDFQKQKKQIWRLPYSTHSKEEWHCNSSLEDKHILSHESTQWCKKRDVYVPPNSSKAIGRRYPANVNCKPSIGPVQVVRRQKTLRYEKVGILGEFDFLFKANSSTSSGGLVDNVWTEVHHWEGTAQFLLYTGPWEAFGLVTPGSSVWNRSGKRIFTKLEGLNNMSHTIKSIIFETLRDMKTNAISVLDACLVGPVFGETFFHRKRRMHSQLNLSCNVNSAAKICTLFNAAVGQKHDGVIASNEKKREKGSINGNYGAMIEPKAVKNQEEMLQGPHGGDYRQDASIIRVIPKAMTKGYVFYEWKLWLALTMQRDQNGGSLSVKQPTELTVSDWLRNISVSDLNPDHWIGWWVYASDFAEFGLSPPREKSMWYVASETEWLSPVIISPSQKQRCARVFNLVGLMTVANKIAEEAAEMKPCRKRRFMVVEVCWAPELCTREISPFMIKQDTGKHRNAGVPDVKGAWVEVSRGFIVEETWPDSRGRQPHGLSPS